MRTKFLMSAAALAVAGAVLAGVAAAGSVAKQQRIAIALESNSSRFVLTPLTSGPVGHDSGTVSSCCWTRRFSTRDGESIEIDNPTSTFTGKRGTFTWHERITFIASDNDYTIGDGVWTMVKGTGAYAHLTGHGREALVLKNVEDRRLASKAEGLISVRP